MRDGENNLINIRDAIEDHVIIRLDQHLKNLIVKLGLYQIRDPNNPFLMIFKYFLEKWHSKPLPLFKVVAEPGSTKWELRISHEIEIFQHLIKRRKFQTYFIPFKGLRKIDLDGRYWLVTYLDPITNEPKGLEISLPVRYPFYPPILVGDSLHVLNVCLRKMREDISSLWRKDGKYGIPHFLAYFVSFSIYMEALYLKVH